MENPVRHRIAPVEVDGARADRLSVLADRLERTLAHHLIELGPLAWTGADADIAVDRLRARAIELSVAAAGLRTCASRIGGTG